MNDEMPDSSPSENKADEQPTQPRRRLLKAGIALVPLVVTLRARNAYGVDTKFHYVPTAGGGYQRVAYR